MATIDAVRRRSEELENTAEKLSKTGTYLQTLMDALVDILVTTDLSGIITDANQAMETFTGYALPNIVDRPFHEFFADPEAAKQALQRVLDKESLTNCELTMITRQGKQIPISYSATVFRDSKGNISGVVGSARDITEIKRTEEVLTRQAEELQRSNAELEQFAYVASHDLQEPLRKIQTFADILKSTIPAKVLGEEEHDFLDRMQDAASRMQFLINDLLTLSRITTRAQPFVKVDLSQIIQEVLCDLEVTIAETDGQVEVEPLPVIEAEPTQVRQLVQNLISNALKFHRPGEKPVVRVSGNIVKTQEDSEIEGVNEICELIVEDNGIGFDEKYLERIFTVFQRLHGRGEYEGTGIGLAICRKIVDRHGGKITARSKPGEGAKFVVTLPVLQIADGPVRKPFIKDNI